MKTIDTSACRDCSEATISVPAIPAPKLRRYRERPLRERNADRAWCALPLWLREALAACGVFEWVTLAYLGALSFLILTFRSNVPGAVGYLAAHTAIGASIVLLSRAVQRWPFVSLRFVRHWYPLALFVGFFEELHYLVHLIFPGWFDRWLIQFDYALLGVHPTVWLEQFATPLLNDLMQMAYMTYFFYLVILAGILFVRDEERAFWRMMTSTAAAYYIVYLISVFFPIEAPFHSLAALQRIELTGGFFTSLIGFVESFGRVHGAAFPSAHVAGSFVALLGAWRYRRWLFWIFLPFFLTMLVATVYGRYHYIADGLAGLLTGAVGFKLGGILTHEE